MKQWQTILIDLVVKGVSAWWNKKKETPKPKEADVDKTPKSVV
jgi:hypothetical protein